MGMRVTAMLGLGDWATFVDEAKAVEAAGFDAIGTVELGNDPFMPLALAALATKRVDLTTSIAVAFPRSPTVMAHIAFDLQKESRGRFHLGLGSQVKGHNERRYGIQWSPPAPRLQEYVEAVRAIWRCWETGEKLAFEGRHYRLSLMTPDFSPKPSGLAAPPISIAAVGDAMLRVAGRVADGVRLHPLCSRRYLEDVCLPEMLKGMAQAGRARANFEINGGGFVCTGPDEASVARAMDWARRRIGFYGSTRTYLPILKLHGLEELGQTLHAHSVAGRWDAMAGEVSDAVVRIFAACGTYDRLAGAIGERFGGVADMVDINFPLGTPAGFRRELVQDIQRIPIAFEEFSH
ncbi:MAG: TIGR03617 family F420-dependent LLM class oxidoreductase [Alphaproteobacteria bacterium]|nr:TIGR03617 family F420-dependent LLM class oxidoreductase [Alphaproteobacteria bacterium]